MAQHGRFHYRSLDELKEEMAAMGLDVPVSADVSPLFRPIQVGGKALRSRIAINPMEGCDGTADGRPSELTRRRYRRFGAGGAGLVWYEATAVVNEGRANPRQLQINAETGPDLASTLAGMAEAAKEAGRPRPYSVLQLTHSGRYSRPGSLPAPVVAVANPYLDIGRAEVRVISDEEIEALEERYVEAAGVAAECGFDAVDIKACHGYLLGELLTAHTREGRYGGSFESRTRALVSIVEKIASRYAGRLTLAVRLGVYDQMPHPYGWGTDESDYHRPDYTEPTRLVRLLSEKGVRLFSITLGNPYYNPHLTRPYDVGGYVPPVHPVEGVGLLLGAAKKMQEAAHEAVIMCAGLSWLRQFSANVAAGCIDKGWMGLAGFGRQAIANPSFADDLEKTGAVDTKKTCVTCSRCTTIMRDGGCAGCVARDRDVYGPIYEKGREGKPPAQSDRQAEHL